MNHFHSIKAFLCAIFALENYLKHKDVTNNGEAPYVGEWHTGVLVNQFFRVRTREREPEMYIVSVCQFLWCKHSHHSRFQATNKTSLNLELGREMQN